MNKCLFGITLFLWIAYVNAGIIEDLPNYHVAISGGPQGYYYVVDQDAPLDYPNDVPYYGAGYQYGFEITHNLRNYRLGVFWDIKNPFWGKETVNRVDINSKIKESTVGISFLSPLKLVTWYNLKFGIISTQHSYVYKNQEILESRFTPGIEIFNGIIKEFGISNRLKLGVAAGVSLSAHLDEEYGFKSGLCKLDSNDNCIKFDKGAFLGGARISTTLSLIY